MPKPLSDMPNNDLQKFYNRLTLFGKKTRVRFIDNGMTGRCVGQTYIYLNDQEPMPVIIVELDKEYQQYLKDDKSFISIMVVSPSNVEII